MFNRSGAQSLNRTGLLLFVLLSLLLPLIASSCRPGAPTTPPQILPPSTGVTQALTDSATPSILPEQPLTATPPVTPPPPKRPIYIVDPNNQGILSNIFMIDPDTQRLVWTIQSRSLPDAVLSPDGQRLYVADSYSARVTRGPFQDVLSAYDAHSGELIVDDAPIQGRLHYQLAPYFGQRYLFFSDDERQLFVEKYGDPNVHQLRLAALDPQTLQPLFEGLWPHCDFHMVALAGHWICIYGKFLVEINPKVNPKLGFFEEEKRILDIPGSQVMGVAFDAQKQPALHYRLSSHPGDHQRKG